MTSRETNGRTPSWTPTNPGVVRETIRSLLNGSVFHLRPPLYAAKKKNAPHIALSNKTAG